MSNNQTLTIAIIQYAPVWNDQISNLSYLETQLENLTNSPNLVLLPEMFDTGFMSISNDINAIALGNSITLQWMQTSAQRFNVYLCGSLTVNEQNSFYNRMILVSPDGHIQHYDKRHLFSIGNEQLMYTAGNERKIWNLHLFNILPLICYDLRFPVWSRNRNDYHVILLSANWPASRQEVWEILLRARAIENQTFVIACNRIGTDGNNIIYKGGSCAINYKGEIMAELGNEVGTLYVTLNLNQLNEFRNKFPTLKDGDNFKLMP